MKRLLFSILFSAAIGASSVGASEPSFNQYDHKLISDIIYLVFTDRYDAALSLCDSIIAVRSDDPAGYFFRAYTLMAAMTEEHDDSHREAFVRSLDSVEYLVTRIVDTCQTDRRAWCYWYLGNVWAYRALWTGRFGSSASAYKLATKARKQYEKSLDCDSTLYDNYAGLGAVHYWKSAKGGLFRTLGLIRDERAKGIAELKLAAASATLSRETAQKTLITVLNDYNQYDTAIAYAKEMLDRYPDGRSFLWGISYAFYHKGDFARAHQYFQRLRKNLEKRPGNYYKLIECDAQIARCLEGLHLNEAARSWAMPAIVYIYSVPEEVRDKQKENIEYLIELASD